MEDWERQVGIVEEYLEKRADVMLDYLELYLTEADGE